MHALNNHSYGKTVVFRVFAIALSDVSEPVTSSFMSNGNKKAGCDYTHTDKTRK